MSDKTGDKTVTAIAIDARNLPFWDNCKHVMKQTVFAGGSAECEESGTGMDVGAAVIAGAVMQHIGIACALMEMQGVEGAADWFKEFATKLSLPVDKQVEEATKGFTIPGLVGHA
jgi:hypothetical protein